MQEHDSVLLALWHSRMLTSSTILKLSKRIANPEFSLYEALEIINKERESPLPSWKQLILMGEETRDLYLHYRAKPLFYDEAEFPEQLRLSGHQPFPILIVAGNPAFLRTPQLAIVGSRDLKAEGMKTCQTIARAAIERGFTITSGGALGVDACAHRCCIQAGSPTVLVAATGIDLQYPSENRDIYEYCQTNGAVVSPFPLFTPPTRYMFPERNTVIAALAISTIIIQAKRGSGALYTAESARKLGKEVKVASASPFDFSSEGGLELVKAHKAELLTQLEDLPAPGTLSVQDANPAFIPTLASPIPGLAQGRAEQPKLPFVSYDAFTTAVLERFAEGAHTREQLAALESDYAKLNDALLTLELDGVIERSFGDTYILNKNYSK